jgi:hypothetical protein
MNEMLLQLAKTFLTDMLAPTPAPTAIRTIDRVTGPWWERLGCASLEDALKTETQGFDQR